MCLLVFSIGTDGGLVAVANRDEAYARPTAALAAWPDAPNIIAGRDLRAGGTWFGVTLDGRVAAITNFRGARGVPAGAPSRGDIPVAFLRGSQSAEQFVRELSGRAADYAGFSVVLGAAGRYAYFSNVEAIARELPPGLYGLSNRWLDTDWPKVRRAKDALATALARGLRDAASLCELLHDREPAADAELPDTGIGLELERAMSPSFIVTPTYGTRSTSALILRAPGSVDIYEKSFGPGGAPLSEVGQRFTPA